ncbi:3-(3-hydroxy-phenyl)propionate/3-hydroxycinnamic acid hydroxylase [Aquimixticola soesokkakensis]|uniref:3-(3-hydroxy-phenyl)propionate/3-hydroxycinnamic acid hydroxylase n=1 Tax=Aquimixticola soesokkakensis TaxID=1519096 RepID=A0A1Y5TBA0_9RHOB|nr:bifunctional 3-(3-hydroxy-phenyl)propionate/3-hydroxycinnamic acid hydroxylase [Aquimixticola soesokkakensis]SLN60182.1 3-(3-hydroxy-phenyl)propionate/3-hydroxycinnamic acid hydroxylase [Aquimixticola soesokkakensis]
MSDAKTQTVARKQWDVIIVGGGPVGVFAAHLLARSGHRVRIIERDPAPYSLPRAVHVDHEIMRLFNGIGLFNTFHKVMRAGDGHIHIGADQGVIRFLSAAGKPRPFGHANDYFFYQPEMEQILRAGLARYAQVQLDTGLAVETLSQDADSVTVTLSDGTTDTAAWVIGCDGARSTVRKALGIALDDLQFEEPWLVVDAEVEGPITFPAYTGLPAGANLQNLSLMQCDPARPATIVPGRGNHRRWEFMLLPGESDSEMAEPARVAAMVAPWVGEAAHKIIRAATYRFHGLVAEDWQQGRVFLAGDAAHQTPPFFGQGLCHGFRDAANLAWKLDLVIGQKAGAALFATYQRERDAQVRHVIGAAVEAGRYICELDPAKAAARDARLRAQTGMRTASDLIAPIASQIIGAGAGERFINPTLGGGRLLDDVLGQGWRVIARADLLAHQVLDLLAARCVSLADLPDPEGHLAAWFDAREAGFVLLRPDHYVAVLARNPAEFRAALAAMAQNAALRLPETTD